MTARILPSFTELPLSKGGEHRDPSDLARMAIIPAEDSELRAAAVRLYLAEEAAGNAAGKAVTPALAECRDARLELPDVRAFTPGGLAWKLLTALDDSLTPEENHWEPWQYLLKSAAVDALELERAREESAEGGRDAELEAIRSRLSEAALLALGLSQRVLVIEQAEADRVAARVARWSALWHTRSPEGMPEEEAEAMIDRIGDEIGAIEREILMLDTEAPGVARAQLAVMLHGAVAESNDDVLAALRLRIIGPPPY